MGADDSTESVLRSQQLRPLRPVLSSVAARFYVPVQLRCFCSTDGHCHASCRDVTTRDAGVGWGPVDATSTSAVPSLFDL